MYQFLKEYRPLVNDVTKIVFSEFGYLELHEEFYQSIIINANEHNKNIAIGKKVVKCFSKNDLLLYLGTKNGSINVVILDKIIELFVQRNILMKNFVLDGFMLNTAFAKALWENNIYYDTIFGPEYCYEKYQKSCFKIISQDSDDKSGLGTGFILGAKSKTGGSLVLTNKHVIDGRKNIVVESFTNEKIEYEEIYKSEKYDLAIISLREQYMAHPINPRFEPVILSDVTIMGYPYVPLTRANYLLAHRGEINSIVTDYSGISLLVISAKTNPGNSGGPVLDTYGSLVGIVVENLNKQKTDINDSFLPYHCAIEVSQIVEFVNDYQKK